MVAATSHTGKTGRGKYVKRQSREQLTVLRELQVVRRRRKTLQKRELANCYQSAQVV